MSEIKICNGKLFMRCTLERCPHHGEHEAGDHCQYKKCAYLGDYVACITAPETFDPLGDFGK